MFNQIIIFFCILDQSNRFGIFGHLLFLLESFQIGLVNFHGFSRAALAQESIIVLTHHLPSYKLVHPKYEGHPLNFCFAVNLEEMMVSPVRGWLCGHSHTGCEVEINGVKCGLNPFGYPGEPSTSFNREKVLEITCESHDGSCDLCDETCFDECDD
jgi:hypothetical protein